jgi:hypothetical protein
VRVLARLSDRVAKHPKSLHAARDIAIACMEDRVKSLILLVPVGAVVYIVLLGEGRVSLKRGSMHAILMEKPGAISGEVQEGDTIILMTKSASDALPHDVAGTLFDHEDAPAVAEKMTLAIHTRADLTNVGAGSAALIIGITGLFEKEAESVALVDGNPPAEHIPLVREAKRAWHMVGRWCFIPLPNAWPRPMVMATFILIAAFLLSVVLGIRRQIGQRVEDRVARVLTQAGHALEEGVALLELNPVKARQRLTEAKTALEPLSETLAPSSIEGRETMKLYDAVIGQLTIAMQVYRVEPVLYWDISLLKDSARIAQIARDGDTVALVSGSTPALVATLTIPTKNGKIVGGGDGVAGGSITSVYGDSVYVLAGGGIGRISVRSAKTTPLVVPNDAQWGTIVSLVSYGGNLYLLDSGKSRIWKYMAVENSSTGARKGFSEMREYLNPDTLPDLSRATGMAVDGGVWVGTSDGTILRFNQGRQESFSPRGVDPAFGKTLVVDTSDKENHLYVLDSENKRVVVLGKDGMYVAQYVWTGAIAPTQVAVSEKRKLLLLLADGKLYSIELK